MGWVKEGNCRKVTKLCVSLKEDNNYFNKVICTEFSWFQLPVLDNKSVSLLLVWRGHFSFGGFVSCFQKEKGEGQSTFLTPAVFLSAFHTKQFLCWKGIFCGEIVWFPSVVNMCVVEFWRWLNMFFKDCVLKSPSIVTCWSVSTFFPLFGLFLGVPNYFWLKTNQILYKV